MLDSMTIRCQYEQMWISALSDRSGLSVATIKFYLREGLLPPGDTIGATRALYDETHVHRLRLIRALVEVAGLRLDAVHAILAAVDDERLPMHEVIGTAHSQLSIGSSTSPPSEAAQRRVDLLVRRWKWRISPASGHRAALARALDALSTLDASVSDDLVDDYASAMGPIAVREVAAISTREPARATEMAVIGTLLLEPVLLTIRRLAQENASSRTLRRQRPR